MVNLSPALVQVATRLQSLTMEEKRVLGLRFALDGTKHHTLDEVAMVLSTNPDNIRCIEQAALGKLSGSLG